MNHIELDVIIIRLELCGLFTLPAPTWWRWGPSAFGVEYVRIITPRETGPAGSECVRLMRRYREKPNANPKAFLDSLREHVIAWFIRTGSDRPVKFQWSSSPFLSLEESESGARAVEGGPVAVAATVYGRRTGAQHPGECDADADAYATWRRKRRAASDHDLRAGEPFSASLVFLASFYLPPNKKKKHGERESEGSPTSSPGKWWDPPCLADSGALSWHTVIFTSK